MIFEDMKFFNKVAQLTVAMLVFFGISASAQKLSFEPEALQIAPGSEAEVTINFAIDAEKAWSGFNFYVVLPEGLSYVADESGQVAVFGGANPEHIVLAKLSTKNEKKLTLGLSSMDFLPMNDDKVTFKVKADESLAASSQIKITDILFLKSSTDGIYCDDVVYDVTRAEATAINEVNAEAATAEIFNVAGVQQKSLKNGQVNILRDVNGKITKVFKK